MTQADYQRVVPHIMTPQEFRDREDILAHRYYIVRQGTIGEYMRCKGFADHAGCGGVHNYLTLHCVERPFSSVTRGLYVWYRANPAAGAGRSQLRPDEQRKLAELDRRIFGMRVPTSLSSTHPELARKLAGGDQNSYDLGGIALGILEPISAAKAQRLVDMINMRAGRQIITLDTLDVDVPLDGRATPQQQRRAVPRPPVRRAW